MSRRRLKVGSLFSGIGGLDLGLERAGMEVIWQVESDPYCLKVLAKNSPQVKRYGDIKAVDFTRVPSVDLICGGFPCQPCSCAGKRQGTGDPRWLWPEFYRAVCEARPQWVLVENVPGLLSADHGRLFGGILGDLARRGYDAEWSVLSACAMGAPHTRKRLFIVAYSEGIGWQVRRIFEAVAEEKSEIGRQGETNFWAGGKTASEFFRMADGISPKMERLGIIGNAVLPQVAEWIGRQILRVEDDESSTSPAG